MDVAHRRAAARRALRLTARRWLGPRAWVRVLLAQKRARARARAQLKAWVAAHAGSGAPASAGWMVSTNVPGADRALEWMRDAMELPLATDTWRSSKSCLINASISHSDAAAVAAQEAKDIARAQWIKANFQASEEEDLLLLEVDELCREKRQDDWEDMLYLMGYDAVVNYSPLDDVPLSIRTRSLRASGSHGCGGSGASWGPRLRRRHWFASPAFHENVAPYEPAHVGIESMRFVPDLTSSRVPLRLTSRPKAIRRIEI